MLSKLANTHIVNRIAAHQAWFIRIFVFVEIFLLRNAKNAGRKCERQSYIEYCGLIVLIFGPFVFHFRIFIAILSFVWWLIDCYDHELRRDHGWVLCGWTAERTGIGGSVIHPFLDFVSQLFCYEKQLVSHHHGDWRYSKNVFKYLRRSALHGLCWTIYRWRIGGTPFIQCEMHRSTFFDWNISWELKSFGFFPNWIMCALCTQRAIQLYLGPANHII